MDIEVVEFTVAEGNFFAEIISSVFQVVDAVGAEQETLDLFFNFIEALDRGHTIEFVDAED